MRVELRTTACTARIAARRTIVERAGSDFRPVDTVFNHGMDLPAFATHTLLGHEAGRQALSDYITPFLTLPCGDVRGSFSTARPGGPSDAYTPEHSLGSDEACEYHREQLGWLEPVAP